MGATLDLSRKAGIEAAKVTGKVIGYTGLGCMALIGSGYEIGIRIYEGKSLTESPENLNPIEIFKTYRSLFTDGTRF
jgi:hypothetical protein